MDKKIIELAKQYANSYKYCFHSESTQSWISRFASSRWEHTLTDTEISDKERNDKDLRELFIKEFVKETKQLIKKKNTVVGKDGKKTTLVKRKKD